MPKIQCTEEMEAKLMELWAIYQKTRRSKLVIRVSCPQVATNSVFDGTIPQQHADRRDHEI